MPARRVRIGSRANVSPESPSPGGAPAPPEGTLTGIQVLVEIGQFLVRRARFLGALSLLTFAVPLLVLGWRMVSGTRAERALAARLTARGEGAIVESFWRLDVRADLAAGNEPLSLSGNTLAEVWAIVEPDAAARAAGVPARLAYRVAQPPPLPIQYADAIDGKRGSALQLPWNAPGSDWPSVEIRLPRRVAVRLRATTSEPWIIQYTEDEFAADRRPGSELDAFRIEADEPWDDLVTHWLRPPASSRLALAYDPARPGDAMPLVDLEALRGKVRWPLLVTAAILFAFGGAFYLAAAAGLFAGLSPRLAVPLAVAGLLALPWWSGRVEQLVEWASPGAGRFARELSQASFEELLADRLPQVEPPGDDERLVIDPRRGFFAATLAPFEPHRPATLPVDGDAAWRALTVELADQALALPPATQQALLERLVTDERRDRRRAGEALLRAADRLSREAGDENVRDWARSFLLHRLRAVNDPEVHELAFAVKLADRQALTEHPDAKVREYATASLARIAEWRRRTGD